MRVSWGKRGLWAPLVRTETDGIAELGIAELCACAPLSAKHRWLLLLPVRSDGTTAARPQRGDGTAGPLVVEPWNQRLGGWGCFWFLSCFLSLSPPNAIDLLEFKANAAHDSIGDGPETTDKMEGGKFRERESSNNQTSLVSPSLS